MSTSNPRVVEVWAESPGGWAPGTGHRIGGRLVLTSAHVLPASATTAEVRLAGVDGTREARLRWRGDGDLDAAVLELFDPLDVRPERFGRITGRRAVRCSAIGFPNALIGDRGRREAWELAGEIRPGSGRKARIHHLVLDDHPGEAITLRADGTRWSGYSGAAVFAGDLLIGVVIRDRDRTGGLHLEALPVERLLEDPGFRRAVGDVPELRSVELAPFFTPDVTPPRSPSSFLRPDAGVTRFRGHTNLLRDLADGWAGSAEPMSVMLLTGAGGQGKTRFAAALCAELRGRGWVAGRLRDRETDPGPVVADTALPLLVVADYAETRTRELAAMLEWAARRNDGPPLRFLLLARTRGEWWDRFRTPWPETRAVVLPSVVATPDARGDEFLAARAEFAATLGIDTPTTAPPDLSAATTPLAVHMLALSEVLQSGQDAIAVPTSTPPVPATNLPLTCPRRSSPRSSWTQGAGSNHKKSGEAQPGSVRAFPRRVDLKDSPRR